MKRLIIDEQRWLRAGKNGGLVSGVITPGEGETELSCLYQPINKRMCCLGFAARRAGLKVEDIAEVAGPADLNRQNLKASKKFEAKFPWLFDEYGSDSKDAKALMKANDDFYTSVAQKRAIVKKIFAKHGWAVEFR